MADLGTLANGAVLVTLLAVAPDDVPNRTLEPSRREVDPAGSRMEAVEERALACFRARTDEPVRSFRARRRMHARGLGKEARMEVLVELDPEGGFRFTVVEETGSGLLRDRVFWSMLEKEAELRARDGDDSTSLTARNYTFRADGRDSDGLVRLRAVPRRREAGLVDGSIVVTPDTADLVRIEGRLARAPSFWTPRVELVRHFRRIRGHRVVVRIESVAHVRFLGSARLTIDFDYETIDGDPIPREQREPAPVAGAASPSRLQAESDSAQRAATGPRGGSTSPGALEEGVLVNGLALSAVPRPGQPPMGMAPAGVDAAQPVSGTTSDTPQSSRGAHEFP